MDNMVEKENVDSQSVVLVGIFGAIVVFVLTLGIQVLYYRMERADTYVKDVAPGFAKLKHMVAEQQGSLNGYHWVDRDKEVVAIPIDKAMDLTVHNLQGAPPP